MIYLAFTHGKNSEARLFRDNGPALEWLLTPKSEGGPGGSGGEVHPLERIDFDRDFRPILHRSSNPDRFGEDHIR